MAKRVFICFVIIRIQSFFFFYFLSLILYSFAELEETYFSVLLLEHAFDFTALYSAIHMQFLSGIKRRRRRKERERAWF